MAIQIKVGNNTYSSIAAAWRAESVGHLPLVTVRWRLKNGWSPEHAFHVVPVAPEIRRKFKEIRE
jgi:hypothetical protein